MAHKEGFKDTVQDNQAKLTKRSKPAHQTSNQKTTKNRKKQNNPKTLGKKHGETT